MPELAAFTAKLRSAFGNKAIDQAVRRGKTGSLSFSQAKMDAKLAQRRPQATSPGRSMTLFAGDITAPVAMVSVSVWESTVATG